MRFCIVSLLAVTVLFSGCASTQKMSKRTATTSAGTIPVETTQLVMDTWKGRSIDEVSDAWGAADLNMKRIDGGVTYTWITYSSGKNGVQQCRQSFVTDAAGIVVSWSYVDCPKYIKE